jgi:hypothetical protein
VTSETYLVAWRDLGLISPDQYTALSAIVRKERFSVFVELNAALYLGVLAIAAGSGWTAYAHFASLGDFVVLLALNSVFAGCLFYCFTRDEKTFVFDYVLYLGALTFAVVLGFIEFRYHLLRANSDYYLLASALVYFALAYRFDNRFVLSLALSALAGWFGVRLSTWLVLNGSIRDLMFVYGALVAGVGVWLHQAEIKPHFLETYLHVAANAMLAALASAAMDANAATVWVAVLVGASAASIALGSRYRRFSFVVYGFVYAYLGVSTAVVRRLHGGTEADAYFIVSALGVVLALVAMAKRRGAE